MDAPVSMVDAPVMGQWTSAGAMPVAAAPAPAADLAKPMLQPTVVSSFTPTASLDGLDADAMFAAAEAQACEPSPVGQKRRTELASLGSGTPSKAVPRWTPSKLSKSDVSNDVRSAKKVMFSPSAKAGSAVPSLSGGSQPIFDGLDDDESAAANAEGEDAFPIFSSLRRCPTRRTRGRTSRRRRPRRRRRLARARRRARRCSPTGRRRRPR